MTTQIEKKLTIFASHEEADIADRKEILAMTGEERIARALELMASYYEHTPRLERIYRVVERKDLPISDGWRVGV